MNLQTKITEALKEAMKAKDTMALESLRAIKSAILLANTEAGASGELSEEDEIKLLQKLVKQRKESALLYQQKGRKDLATPELAQADIISQFLPKQLDQTEVEKIIKEIIAKVGASGMKDMGKVMGNASKELAGKADGKLISSIVKKLLS
ncbi:GatB/YqeY domain-containing protein [Capnocytophaga catalasegens]|uniref:Aspartyl-tRNA amidotransferase subunit B n=1 Tax=Capnocytophaga catalasegens TaxID=1004260 RepID=A0AAV5AXU3_9FLAO|nr:GatB/YqeY domain-containing protein [Capnocytophaga catalasegens]GIZ15657.1 aspartyl-tRNA amidotransferase subunit B [Capnocytophaga catalasegens]GJM49552.1 aspartyl-tRNA amidotransferase subunit B [Capnocytophaga catalasegens]GJM51739.1 aspartyl-tRNA amidotransferase subunit B [Capnocytophaga catalasegens]